MTKHQAEIILAYAKNNMNAKATSKQLYMNDANVGYHLNKIKKQIGWNPREFFDLCYLVGIAAQVAAGDSHDLLKIGGCQKDGQHEHCGTTAQ